MHHEQVMFGMWVLARVNLVDVLMSEYGLTRVFAEHINWFVETGTLNNITIDSECDSVAFQALYI